MNIRKPKFDVIGTSFVSFWLFVISWIPAWFTHVFVSFAAGQWGFLIAGAIFFPVAIVHGYGVWFGVW